MFSNTRFYKQYLIIASDLLFEMKNGSRSNPILSKLDLRSVKVCSLQLPWRGLPQDIAH